MAAQAISYGTEVNANAKTELVAFCQRKSSKSMKQGDIVYKVDKWNNQYQATVRLNCLGGEEFAGELCATERQAEHAAAHQALLANAEELRGQQAHKRKAMEAAHDPQKWAKGEDGLPFAVEDTLDPTVKGKLHAAVKQLLGREADQTDIVYDIQPQEGGMQARLTLPSVPGLADRSWLGEVTPTKQGSRLSAASQALRYIMQLPEAAKVDLSLAKLPNLEVPKNKGAAPRKGGVAGTQQTKGLGKSGKGLPPVVAMMKGKGKGMFDWGSMFQMMSTMFGGRGLNLSQGAGIATSGGDWGGDWSGDWGGSYGGSWGGNCGLNCSANWGGSCGGDWGCNGGSNCGMWGGNCGNWGANWGDWGSNFGKGGNAAAMAVADGSGRGGCKSCGKGCMDPCRADLQRRRITQIPITGDVVEWAGECGWVRPHVEIGHPRAGQRQGNLYVHKKDIVKADTLQGVGMCQFHVYETSAGLGAEEVMA